jgi:hypothetical protein
VKVLDIGGIPQFEDYLLLNLPDALSRKTECLTHFFQSVLVTVKTETHPDDLFFSRC